MRFRLRTTRNWSGEAPECEELTEGGVGVIVRSPGLGFDRCKKYGECLNTPPVSLERNEVLRFCSSQMRAVAETRDVNANQG